MNKKKLLFVDSEGVKMAKSVSTVLNFVERTFQGENGAVKYLEITAKVNGEVVRFSVKKEDKSLLNMLLKSVPELKS